MRPAEDIERLLTRLEDHASAAFDQRTLRDMFSALDLSRSGVPARSWQEAGRAIMRSRITKLAAAAVLALALLLLVRHLTGQERTVPPGDRSDIRAEVPEDQNVPIQTVPDQELQQTRVAQELFVKADVQGLLQLLDTGLDRTRIVVADYLAQVGDESALPALQKLAEQWRGPAEDNPFRKSIEQIRGRSSRRDKVDAKGTTQEETPVNPPAAENNHILIAALVSEKATGAPIPQAPLRIWVRKAWETNTSDDQGMFLLDVGEAVPSQVMILVRPPGYVGQGVELRNLSRQNLPKRIQFALDKGTVIGGVVQDSTGRPIPGASVESYIQEPQKFDQPHVSVSIKETTDDQGRWRSTCLPAQISRLWFNVYHAEFADGGFEMPKDLKLDDLRAERAVMVLQAGIAVAGRVTDAAGKPIAGADLLAGEDYYARDWTKTDAAGGFEFAHLRTINRSFLLTVQAKGFAPQRKELPSEQGLAPVQFILQPAKLLIGRVVDVAGHPVAGAFVTTERWNRYRTVRWQANTDARGGFVWDYPPADAIEVRINKAGFREITKEVVANDQEQTFVLTKPMTIQGTVTDSQTGAPVSRFKVTPGIQWGAGDNRATWQPSEGWVRWFAEGRYSYTFNWDGRAYAIRVEAEGYVPAESRFVDANEAQATMDIKLTKGEGPSGHVFDVQARPVGGAEVFWTKNALIMNGQAGNKQSHVYVITDSDGHFAFKADNRKDPLLVLCDQGVGAVSYEEFAQSGIITLTPWARVQGDLRIGSQPAAHKTLQLMYSTSPILEGLHLISDETATDENGRFVFERVYPREFTLCNETYEVTPGQTLELHLGGTGRTVQGEFILAGLTDLPIWADLGIASIGVPVPFDKFPKPPGYERMTHDEVQTWLDGFGESREGKAYLAWLEETYPRTGKSLRLEMDGQGTFHVDNVAPGTYALSGIIRRMPVYERSETRGAMGTGLRPVSEVIARLWHEFAVPPLTQEGQLDIPLDLGTLTLLSGELKPGDPAPDFDVPTFGPERIRLKDYQGKTLLVGFFSTRYVDRRSQVMEDLRNAQRRFREDPRYAQISLLFPDYYLPLDKKAVEEAGLGWPHGLLTDGGRESTEYGIPATLSRTVLVGPQGDILAIGLFGEALMQAIEQALLAGM